MSFDSEAAERAKRAFFQYMPKEQRRFFALLLEGISREELASRLKLTVSDVILCELQVYKLLVKIICYGD